ncbi:MAG: hypothetical protein ACK4RK_00590 [Gemmataceae bacterium]
MAKKDQRHKKEVVGFVGVGLDNQDEQQRLTRAEHFVLIGGSKETHERMQETAIKFNEELDRRGKPLPETSVEEILEIFHEIHE